MPWSSLFLDTPTIHMMNHWGLPIQWPIFIGTYQWKTADEHSQPHVINVTALELNDDLIVGNSPQMAV